MFIFSTFLNTTKCVNVLVCEHDLFNMLKDVGPCAGRAPEHGLSWSVGVNVSFLVESDAFTNRVDQTFTVAQTD